MKQQFQTLHYNKPQVIVSNPGTAVFVQSSIKGYYNAGLLNMFLTSIAYKDNHLLYHLLNKTLPSIGSTLQKKRLNFLPNNLIKQHSIGELVRLAAAKFTNGNIADFIWEKSEKNFDYWVSLQIKNEINWVHTYEHAALETLKVAKAKKIHSIYEQTSAHHSFYTSLFEQTVKEYAEFANFADTGLVINKAIKRNERRDAELATAEYIRCNSSFVKHTLINAGINEKKISVIPLGFPEPVKRRQQKSDKKLIFLHVGKQRLVKGSHLVYLAWKKLNITPDIAELWMVGNYGLPEFFRQDLPLSIKIIAHQNREELEQLYQQANVLLSPSLSDGFGMVVTEAMSNGIFVIASENTGAKDVITNEKDGLIIKANDVEHLMQSIKWCVEHPQETNNRGLNALDKANSWQWSHHANAVANFIIDESAAK